MVKGIVTRYQRLQAATALMLLSASVSVQAGLPSVATPTGASANSTNFLEIVKQYAKEGITALGLIIGASVFVLVVKNAMGVYSEIGTGKKTWSDLTMHVVVGGLLLVVAVYLLTQSDSVI